MISSDKRPKRFSDLLQDQQIYDDLAFVRRLRNAEIITSSGRTRIRDVPNGRNVIFDLSNPTPTGATPANELPAQAGHVGAVLATDGAAPYWTGGEQGNFTSMNRNAIQLVTSSVATWVAIIFDTVVSNAHGVWVSGQPTRFTVPVGQGGVWLFVGTGIYEYVAGGTRAISIWKNGTVDVANDQRPANASLGSNTQINVTALVVLADGDYIELKALQDSGSTTNTYGLLAGVRLGEATASVSGGGGGFTNPMTTAGDLIQGGVAGVAERLAAGSEGSVAVISGGRVFWLLPGLPGAVLTLVGNVPTWIGGNYSGLPDPGTDYISGRVFNFMERNCINISTYHG